jgi:urease accessory protein
MDRDARKMRGTRPFYFTHLKEDRGVAEIADFIVRAGGLAPARAEAETRDVGTGE